jgi:hypothetical protein
LKKIPTTVQLKKIKKKRERRKIFTATPLVVARCLVGVRPRWWRRKGGGSADNKREKSSWL